MDSLFDEYSTEAPGDIDEILVDSLDCTSNLEYDTMALDITALVINSIGLLFVLIISTSSIRNLIKMKKIATTLKWLFYISIMSTCLTFICNIAQLIVCLYSLTTLAIITAIAGTFGYYTLLLCLLGTLLVRLYYTFEQSIYKMSNLKKNIFRILYIIVAISSITLVILYSSVFITHGTDKAGDVILAVLILLISTSSLYIIMSIWAVCVFAKNLISLASLQSSTLQNVLNKSQQKLLDRTARYVALFAIAGFTSLITIIITCLESLGFMTFHITLITVGVDCVINIGSLYMQYSFATTYYEKYCKWLHVGCKSVMMRNIKRSTKIKYKPCTKESIQPPQNQKKVRMSSDSMELETIYH